MHIALVIVSVLIAAAGVFQLTQATVGVGIVCVACFIGIMARICQASDHKKVADDQYMNMTRWADRLNDAQISSMNEQQRQTFQEFRSKKS